MRKILNIVNGATVIDIMKTANIIGDYLPWNDFLHDGPVPKGYSLKQLSKIRAHFIHELGFGELKEIQKDFKERDEQLENHQNYEKIVLWFEHDLYDQLQLLQLLSWFEVHLSHEETTISLISTDKYLGECTPTQINQLLLYEQAITYNHLKLATKAWNAFCEPTPQAWYNLLYEDSYVLPFLRTSIERLLEEFPNKKNGLSRSAYQALLVISRGVKEPKKIFIAAQKLEEKKFMGDLIFWKILDNFIDHKLVASKENGKILTITPLGTKLLKNELNWFQFKPIKHWIGGVYLSPDNLWCWDTEKRNIKKYFYSSSLDSLLVIK